MALNQNQFSQSVVLGMMDLRFNTGVIACEVDSTQATAMVPGQAVKMVDSAGGVPKVVGCSANSDTLLGFIRFDIKSQSFAALDKVEIVSMQDSVIYLVATGPIARGAKVSLVAATVGGVKTPVGASGDSIVGFAYDKAATSGDLIRVSVRCPGFEKA
jgi:hypothetical protein